MTHKDTPRSIRYTWDESSHISRLDAQMDNDGFYVVQLFPGKGEKEGALANVPSALHRYGFPDAYPDVKEDQSVLVLANVKSLDKLVRALTGGEYVSGAPTIEAINGHAEKISEQERRKEEKLDTVKWHGRVGLVGHAAIFATGFIQKPFDIGRIINAPLGAANPMLMSWLGSGKDNVDVPQLMRDMRAFFAQEGINLPYMSGEDQQRGFFETAKHFLAAHPIEVGSTLGATGSVAMIGSGWKQMRSGGGGLSRVLIGLVNITRDGIAIFVPEKKKKESEVVELHGNFIDSAMEFPGKAAHLATHPKEIPAAAWGFISGAPLFMVGALSMVSDVLFGVDAADAWQRNKMFAHKSYEQGGTYTRKKWFGLGKEETLTFVNHPSELRANDPTFTLSMKGKHEAYLIERGIKDAAYDEYYHASTNANFGAWKRASAASERLKYEDVAMVNNRIMAKTESWRGKATVALNVVPALAFLGAAVLMMQSTKHHKKDDIGTGALMSRLYSINAKVLAEVPEEMREPMLGRLTDYFRTRKDITADGFDADKFKQEVRARINQMQHNPWTERVSAPAGLASQAAGIAVA